MLPPLCWAPGSRGDRTEVLPGLKGVKSQLESWILSHNYEHDVSRRRWATRAYDGRLCREWSQDGFPGKRTGDKGAGAGELRCGNCFGQRTQASTGMALDRKRATSMVRAE